MGSEKHQITYAFLREKFIDKGMLNAFYWLVLPLVPFDNTGLMGDKIENRITYQKMIQAVYGPEWEYWNTWIDYQQHKF